MDNYGFSAATINGFAVSYSSLQHDWVETTMVLIGKGDTFNYWGNGDNRTLIFYPLK